MESRCYFIPTIKAADIQLHEFSDASERAFAGVVYVRTVYENGVIRERVVAAKSRVSLMKQQTIPRLELLVANILAQLTKCVFKATKLGELHRIHWTDSSAVLCWIRNEKCWKQYVSQRVKEIRDLTDKESWKHCPGVMNPADLPSRGVSVDELVSNSLWWNGPPFLQRPEEEWPELSIKEEIDEGAEVEMVKHTKQVTRVLVGTEDPQIRDIAAVVDCQRFCSKVRLVRVTACVIRFINRLKSMVKRTSEQSLNSIPQHKGLSADEIVNAENMWIRYVQELNFMEELRYLRNESIDCF